MADLLKFEPGIRAKRILVKYLDKVPDVVKANVDQFNNRLVAKGLVAEGLYDPHSITFSRLQSASALYQACMTTVESDPSKFSTLMDILIKYQLLEGAVEEMKKTAVQAKLIAQSSGSVPQEVPHGGARQSQRAAELLEGQSVTMRDKSSVSGGFVGGQVVIQQLNVNQQAQGSSTKASARFAPGILTIKNLKEVKYALGYFSDWTNLGLNLGLHPDLLQKISKHKHSIEDRLEEVLRNWLLMKSMDSDKEPTWNQLVAAIKPIDPALSENIRRRADLDGGDDSRPSQTSTEDQPGQQEPGPVLDHSPEMDPEEAGLHEADDYEQKTASRPPREQPSTIHGASSGQQMQAPSTPERPPSPTSKGVLQTEALLATSDLFPILMSLQGFTSWQFLGLALGMEYSLLYSIDKDKAGNVDKGKTALLHAWLETGKATNSSLVTALKKMGENTIAEKMWDEASSGQQMQVSSTPKRFPSSTFKGTPQNEFLDTSKLFAIKRSLRGLTDWQLLGLALGMEYSLLDSIDKDKGGDVEKCKTAMVHSWLATGKATKSSLVVALKDMGEDSIAESLCGASVDIKDDLGKTPLQVAEERLPAKSDPEEKQRYVKVCTIPHEGRSMDPKDPTLESPLAVKPKKKLCAEVAEFGLEGVEICGEKVFEVTAMSSEKKYRWDNYGFQLTVPSGALPAGVTASVAVKSIVAGPFKFPDNSDLISAIYWISSTHVFLKKVTVHLQHCAIINTEEECSHFKIIIGKCSQDPPYDFAVKDGVFAPNSKIASMSVTQFSNFGAVRIKKMDRIKKFFGIASEPSLQLEYLSLVFHQQLSPIWLKIAVVTVQNLSPYVECVKKKYDNFTYSCDFDNVFEEESECVSIDVRPADEEELWNISFEDDSNTFISKRKVDRFQPKQLNPSRCHLLAKWISDSYAVKNLEAVIKLTDQISHSSRNIKFVVIVPPQPAQATTTPGVPTAILDTLPDGPLDTSHMRAVMAELQHFADWNKLGTNLGLNQGQLNVIEKDASDNYGRLSKVIENWLKRNHNEEECGPPTWGNLAKAIKPIDNALAMKIEGQHGIPSGTADGQPTAGQRIQPTPRVHKADDHEQTTASQPPREQPSTTHEASSGQQMQESSNPEKPPSPTSKGKLTTEALDTKNLLSIKRNLKGLTDWQELGLALDMDFPFLDDIDKNQAGDAEKCKAAMLHAWLTTGKATKSSLVAALREIGEEGIANQL